jgi:hypothetical protein
MPARRPGAAGAARAYRISNAELLRTTVPGQKARNKTNFRPAFQRFRNELKQLPWSDPAGLYHCRRGVAKFPKLYYKRNTMATRTVRLDQESERALAEIRRRTGMQVSMALKRGLLAVREGLRAAQAAKPYDIYVRLDLGPGGYARAPARQAKQRIKAVLARSRSR